MGLFDRWKRHVNDAGTSHHGVNREVRDRLEALQAALRTAEREREDLRRQLDELHRARQREASAPPAVRAADAMRARCARVVRDAMPGETSGEHLYSRHALFDILDDLAREIEALAPLEWSSNRPSKLAN